MREPEKIVMRDSDEAAQYRTDIKGWVSRDGRYWGEGDGGESAARYAGCTHIKCPTCGEPCEKGWTICEDCREKRAIERYWKMPPKEWDGKAPLYSDAAERFFQSPEDAEDYLESEGIEDESVESLRLIVCEPNPVPLLEPDQWADHMPEDDDGDLPPELEKAMDAFNDATRGIVLSWHPGKFRIE